MVKKLFYLNALFDLQLGSFPTASVEKSAAEMSPLFALLGNQEDRVLLDAEVPNEYWDFLTANGIEYALPLKSGEPGSEYTAAPWGWNDHSLARLISLGAKCEYPDLSVVKAVNSRAWCAAFNRRTGTGVPGSCFCQTLEELARAADALSGRFPLVAKPAFGGSGHGFVKIDDGRLADPVISARLERLLEHGCCTLEPWCDRMLDLSTSCVIGRDGSITRLRHYRCLINSHGAFCGVLAGMKDALIEKYRGDLEHAAQTAGRELYSSGYFGPVSFDSFVYRENASDAMKLAPFIEINARQVMSSIAYALFEQMGPNRCCLFTFIGRKRLSLPDSYGCLGSLSGIPWFDPGRRTGVLPVSPLRVKYNGGWTQPSRSAFFSAAENETGLLEIDAAVQRLCGRPGSAISRRWK